MGGWELIFPPFVIKYFPYLQLTPKDARGRSSRPRSRRGKLYKIPLSKISNQATPEIPQHGVDRVGIRAVVSRQEASLSISIRDLETSGVIPQRAPDNHAYSLFRHVLRHEISDPRFEGPNPCDFKAITSPPFLDQKNRTKCQLAGFSRDDKFRDRVRLIHVPVGLHLQVCVSFT